MSSHSIYKIREWMYKRTDGNTGEIRQEYKEGLMGFMQFAMNQEMTIQEGIMACPCIKCCNERFLQKDIVWNHLFWGGFTPGYYIWFSHGENLGSGPSISHSRKRQHLDHGNDHIINDGHTNVNEEDNVVQSGIGGLNETIQSPHAPEEPNEESIRFFQMLDAAKNPIYAGCKEGHSPLSAATRMMNIKTDYNLSEDCVDAWAEFIKDYLPEDNLAPDSYSAIQKLVSGLGLPYQMIDVCKANCMIFWRETENLMQCSFCGHDRYMVSTGRNRIPFQRMWYMPLGERLKRLYQSERTAGAMRWHAEHPSSDQISHPSDAGAWKHFQAIYPDFANESRNVYLGLCTDGFNPFGKSGRKYSLWPVILTPYNLPPALCMRREFLFLTILVPGPNHPRKSLDVFLQPLIAELQLLWYEGMFAYDVSSKINFNMRAVLMWTISDFPAYGMLSGWTTHGRLSCPYCQDNTDAFYLTHGRKSCWFDCHRRFLRRNHPYRRSKTLFTKNKVVSDPPPPELNGSDLITQFRDFYIQSTREYGGNGHPRHDGYGQQHNWHKRSIFWDLPYWKDQLLRHNLDVMHVEKNFFDNIMNTILNVAGKTKDNIKARLDLPYICDREELHLKDDGKGPVPVWRLEHAQRIQFFQWIIDSVKFPDGYASNLSYCVDEHTGRLTGMKSHDCHVFMERLLPFAFQSILPTNVHEAIAGIGAFFRDLCSRSLTPAGIHTLEENIPIILCNLEKLFPPAFFDVMEHLPIHLPREAALGGPVQYRWMYPFERFMYHLKKKVKNLSKVEGSIVAQSINEETSHFSSYYFAPTVQTKARKAKRYDDGGVKRTYPTYVPDIFSEIGRLSGKERDVFLTDQEYNHIHTYILRNCEDVQPFELIFETQVRSAYATITEEGVENMKQTDFANWLKYYITSGANRNENYPTWLEELVGGPLSRATSSPMYCTRGYLFRRRPAINKRSTVNHGVLVRTESDAYYGEITDILEIEYPGIINLKCIMFNCDWYDPRRGRGIRCTKFGVTEVNKTRRLRKYDPFILASQAATVCYIPHPRIRNVREQWLTVHQINPRSRVEGGVYHTEPLQQNDVTVITQAEHSVADIPLVDPEEPHVDEVLENDEDEEEEENDEFEDSSSSDSTAYSSNSE